MPFLHEFWTWFSAATPDKWLAGIAALMVTLRVQSNHEHRKTMKAINGGLLSRLERIENRLDRLDGAYGSLAGLADLIQMRKQTDVRQDPYHDKQDGQREDGVPDSGVHGNERDQVQSDRRNHKVDQEGKHDRRRSK